MDIEVIGKRPFRKRGTKTLANPLVIERYYTPDGEVMIAALRVALGLPKAPPSRQEGRHA
jgi:hypothetical protein